MKTLPRRTFGLALAAAMLCLPFLGSSAEAPAAPKAILLTGAKILTQTDAGAFVGSVLVKDGKIAAIGPSVKAPADAQVIDLAGFTLTPGLIDARSSLWLSPDHAREFGREGSLQITEAIDPYSEDWREAVRQGVATVYVQPRGSLAGFGAVLKAAPAGSAEELIVKADAALAASLYTGAGAPAPAAAPPLNLPFNLPPGIQLPQQQPAAPAGSNSLTRYAQFELLKRFAEGIKSYADSKPSKKDPLKEKHAKLLTKELPLRLEAHLDDDLKNALKLADEFKLKLILEGVSQPKAAAAELKARRTPVVLGPVLALEPFGSLQKGRAANWPQDFLGEETRFAVGTFSSQPRASQWLRLHAAALAAKGLESDRVLRALTCDAADLLGVGDQLGRLAVGHRATLVAFAGDPLDPSAAVRLTMVDGKVVFESPETKARNGAGKDSLTPGLVSAAYAIEGGDETTDPASAELRTADRLDPAAKPLRDLRKAGFTSVVLAPPSGNVVAGELVGCELHSNRAVAGKALGQLFVLTGAARNRERYPASLVGQTEVIDAALSGKPPRSRLFLPEFMQERLYSVRQAALRDLVSQRRVAYFEAGSPAEIEAALALIDKYRLKAVLVEPREVRPFVEELKRLDVAVLAKAPENGDYARTWTDLAFASQAGVPLVFGGASPELIRAAAAAVTQAGADPHAVVAGLTNEGYRRLGMTPPPAVQIAWTGSPLDLRSVPQEAKRAERKVAGR